MVRDTVIGIQIAMSMVSCNHRDLEKAAKSVPGVGNVADDTASEAKAPKYTRTKNKSNWAIRLIGKRDADSDHGFTTISC